MIEIVYYKNHNRLTITGHARSGEPGKDLVCAGVTTLAYTLASNVQELEATGSVRSMTADLEPGRCEISCQPVPRMKHVVELIFRSLCSSWNGSLIASRTAFAPRYDPPIPMQITTSILSFRR